MNVLKNMRLTIFFALLMISAISWGASTPEDKRLDYQREQKAIEEKNLEDARLQQQRIDRQLEDRRLEQRRIDDQIYQRKLDNERWERSHGRI